MLSAVENLGSAGPGRVPYSRHHAHQPQHQHPAQHHGYHPLHTILTPASIGQLQLPPMLGAQTSLPHTMPSVGNEFVRPYPKQRYEDNRGFGIPSALTVEQRLKYGDPPPASAPTHTQTGPVNLAVSNGGAVSGGGGGGGGGDEYGGYNQCHQTTNPSMQSETGESKYSADALQTGTYQQKFQQGQHQQMLDFLGAQQPPAGNRMVCFPAMGSLDVFGGYPPLNYDMYPYRRVHGRSSYGAAPPPPPLPNHRPLESRYSSGAAAFLPPRAPPPPPPSSSDASTSRLPKAAAAPIAIKSKMWHLPLSSPPAPPTPSSLAASHHAGRDIALPTASNSAIASTSDTLVASYRALKSAHLQHPYPRMWPHDPLQSSQANAAGYLNELSSMAGHKEDKGGPQYPLITHSTPISHIPTLQDTYMAALQQHQHRSKFGSMLSTSTDTTSTTSLMQQEFKVPLGLEGSHKPRIGNVRGSDPQLTIGTVPSYTLGMAFDGATNSRRNNIEIEPHELPEDSAAHHQILHTTVLKPKMFLRGSLISFRNGVKKPVEQVRLEDFLRTAAISPDVRLTEAQTRRITPRYSSSTDDSPKRILVRFTYDQQQRHGALETTIDYPFFVTTKGWSSYSPERTFNSYGLECAPMEVGDVFIVLVPRHLSHESIRQEEMSQTATELPREHFSTQQNVPAENKLQIVNVFSMQSNDEQNSPTEENAYHQHRLQQHSTMDVENTSSAEQQREANGSPTITVDDHTPISRDWMAANCSSASKAFGSGKRRPDGQRRANAKRKLAEMQSQEMFRPGLPDTSSAERKRRTSACTESVD